MNNHAAGTALHRRDVIVRIVREGPIRSQEELQEKLGRLGLKVTQPTLSRDLRELAVVKTPWGYSLPDAVTAGTRGTREVDRAAAAWEAPAGRASSDEKLERTLRAYVTSVAVAGTLVVLRTPPASAHPVARALDEHQPPLAVGTIAGDDTVFLATRTSAEAGRLARRLALPLGGSARGEARRRRPGANRP